MSISPTTETVVEHIAMAVADGSKIASLAFSMRFPPPNVKAAFRIAKRRGLIVQVGKNMIGTTLYEMGPHWLAAQSEPRLHGEVTASHQDLAIMRRVDFGRRLGPETASEIRVGIFTMLHKPTTIDDMDTMASIIAAMGGQPCERGGIPMRAHITRLLLNMRGNRQKLLRARRVVLAHRQG